MHNTEAIIANGLPVGGFTAIMHTHDKNQPPAPLVSHGSAEDEQVWSAAYFETVMAQYQARIYRFIYNIVGETETANDLTQDTFLSAYKSLTRRAENNGVSADGTEALTLNLTGHNMSAWLYTIARNTALSEMRRRKIVRFFSFWQRSNDSGEEEFDGLSDLTQDEAGGTLEARTVLHDELRQAMDKVGRDKLTALLLHMDGFSYKEICDITGDSLPSIKSQIFRAKEALRKVLTKSAETEQ